MKDRFLPLHDFLDIFGPPHMAIGPFVLLHLGWWYAAPWYMQYWLGFPMLYFVPMSCTLQSLLRAKHKELWSFSFGHTTQPR